MAASSSPSSRRERPIEERFERAVAVIRSLPQDGPYQPSNMVKLKFYALYKQAREGPNKTSKPGFWDPTARAKWEAWSQCGNASKEECMRMYIEELQRMIETMPQTKQVEEFLISIGPFYEIVPEEKATTPERQAETSQSESMKKEGSESEDDDMFQDSLGDLPSHLEHQDSAELRSPPPPPLAAGSSSPLITSSPVSSSPAASSEQRPSLTGRGGRAGYGAISRRNVRFAERSESSDSGQRGSGNMIPSIQVLTGMITQIQLNIQTVMQQLAGLSRAVNSLDQYSTHQLPSLGGDDERERRGARRRGRGTRQAGGALLAATVVCPVAINIIFSFLARRCTGADLPQWVWGALTACNIAVSLALVLSQ